MCLSWDYINNKSRYDHAVLTSAPVVVLPVNPFAPVGDQYVPPVNPNQSFLSITPLLAKFNLSFIDVAATGSASNSIAAYSPMIFTSDQYVAPLSVMSKLSLDCVAPLQIIFSKQLASSS